MQFASRIEGAGTECANEFCGLQHGNLLQSRIFALCSLKAASVPNLARATMIKGERGTPIVLEDMGEARQTR